LPTSTVSDENPPFTPPVEISSRYGEQTGEPPTRLPCRFPALSSPPR
jgi:hypothetical protein